jgi:hypothetical protein
VLGATNEEEGSIGSSVFRALDEDEDDDDNNDDDDKEVDVISTSSVLVESRSLLWPE